MRKWGHGARAGEGGIEVGNPKVVLSQEGYHLVTTNKRAPVVSDMELRARNPRIPIGPKVFQDEGIAGKKEQMGARRG